MKFRNLNRFIIDRDPEMLYINNIKYGLHLDEVSEEFPQLTYYINDQIIYAISKINETSIILKFIDNSYRSINIYMTILSKDVNMIHFKFTHIEMNLYDDPKYVAKYTYYITGDDTIIMVLHTYISDAHVITSDLYSAKYDCDMGCYYCKPI